MKHDTDPFSRWEAAQRISTGLILELARAHGQQPGEIDGRYIEAFRSLLLAAQGDCAMQAQLLGLPAEAYVSEFMDVIDPAAIYRARTHLKKKLAAALWEDLLAVYNRYRKARYEISADSIGRRRLKNTCLDYLLVSDTDAARQIAVRQFVTADNMTDTIAALSALNDSPGEQREQIMAEFYSKWKAEKLVVDKWLSLQSTSRLPDTLDRVQRLTSHESFNLKNPNRIRALIGAFAQANTLRFHDISGRGYKFITDYVIELDKRNPQVAARLVTVFNNWLRYDEKRQGLIKAQLRRVLTESNPSNDVEEIVSKALAQQVSQNIRE